MANFIISTTDIWAGKWSDPIPFEFCGIDPSLFFDTHHDGKSYICGSAHPGPATRIALFEIDVPTGKKLSGEKDIWSGTGGIYPEGPHIYFKNGVYYLLIAEGGTHEGHSVTMARSKSIWGPYESCPRNPVLTARETDEYVQCTGHCEAFGDAEGNWWGVCLGVRMRNRREERYVLGRETFLTSATWSQDDWLAFDRVKMEVNVPGVEIPSQEERLTAAPGVDFLYIRNPNPSHYNLSDDHRRFTLTGSSADLSAPEKSPTFLGKRQRHLHGTSSVTIPNPRQVSNTHDLSFGLAIYKDEHRFLRIRYFPSTSTLSFEVHNKAKHINRSSTHQLSGAVKTLSFVLAYTDVEYRASYSVDGAEKVLLDSADTMELSGKDFVGPIVGLFVTGEGCEVVFEEFEVT